MTSPSSVAVGAYGPGPPLLGRADACGAPPRRASLGQRVPRKGRASPVRARLRSRARGRDSPKVSMNVLQDKLSDRKKEARGREEKPMQAASTYGRRVVCVLLACIMMLALVPAQAFARTADGMVGISIEVPAQAYVDPTDDTKAASGMVGIRMEVPSQALMGDTVDAKAASGLVGIRLEVPSQAIDDALDKSKGADGLLGIRIEVPTQAYVDPTDDTKTAAGLLGIRMEVPKQAFVEPADDTKATEGLLGIRLEVPSQAFVEPADDTKAAEGLLGIRLAVASTHTVTFSANGGAPDTMVEVLDGACVAVPDPVIATRDKYRVETWCTDPSCAEGTEYDFSKPVLGNLTLYAKWVGPECDEGRYWLHMGAGVTDAQIAGTDKGDAAGDDKGVWTDESIYHGTFLVGKGVNLPEPTRPGYRFVGWHEGADEASALDGATVSFISKDWPGEGGDFTEERQFWAQWEKIPDPPVGDQCTVSFDTNGGSPIDDVRVAPGTVVERPTPDPVRNGYTFAGWYANANRTIPFDFDAPIVGDTVVYAKWTKDVIDPSASYVVAFDTMGGSTVASQRVAPGGTASVPDVPTRAGYGFTGWYADRASALAAGDEGRFDFEAPIERNTTVYAGWEALVFTVVFDAAGGTFEGLGTNVSTVTIEVAGNAPVPSDQIPDDPKRSGWQFDDWYLPDEAAGGDEVVLGEKWNPRSDVTADTRIYAKWSLRLDVTVPVSVGFAVDAGTGDVTTPDANAYALKSRTVAPVVVDAVELRSRQSELDEFFALSGDAPDAPDDLDDEAQKAAWKEALKETSFSIVSSAIDATAIELALATDAGPVDDAEGRTWICGHELADDERGEYTIAAFSYGNLAFDEDWQGADPSRRLGLKFGMTIPTSKLAVNTALEGPQKITHLQVTVSARQ